MSSTTAIGMDYGGTTIKTGVVQDGVIVQRGNTLVTRQDGDIEKMVAEMVEEIQRLRAEHPDVSAVGFGLPGILNPELGLVLNLTNVKGWQDVPLRDLIHKETGLITNIENDAKAMAYAEWKYGAGQHLPNVVCVTLGTGIGGALILNGRLYRGANLIAGEIGQTSIDYQGRDFVYGNKGALEAYIGHWHISARAKEIYAAAGKQVSDEEVEPKQLEKAARQGDPLALELWDDIGLKLGVGLINAIWLVNPHRIVLGGGVAGAGDLIFNPVRRTIETRCAKPFWERLEVVPATLGNDAGVIGAAVLALESEFVLRTTVPR
jgi:glucokinase